MGFEALLGNERLRENLSRSIRRGHISHFYLISGPEGSGKKTLARILAAAILCSSQQRPCDACTACRKVYSGTHPDYITVDDPEKKTVPVDLIRQARSDMYIRPNEGDKKIYLFPRAQDMSVASQNALLKILEEPPAYGVFFLLVDNPEKLLTTIRSRCTELAMTALPEQLLQKELHNRFPQASTEDIQCAAALCGGYLGQAITMLEEGNAQCPHTEAFVKSLIARDSMGLLQTLVPMEKWKRDQFLPLLQRWETVLQNALTCRCGVPTALESARQLSTARSSEELLTAIGHIQKAITYTQGNVSVAAVCGWLEWVLR